jgi:hypothetical protein
MFSLLLLVELLIAVRRVSDGNMKVTCLKTGDDLLRKLLEGHPELGEVLGNSLLFGTVVRKISNSRKRDGVRS